MNTTNIFVEILIVGIQASIWLVLATLITFGTAPIRQLLLLAQQWGNWSSLLTIVIVALCYTLGILIDRIADWFFDLIGSTRILFKLGIYKKLYETVRKEREEDRLTELLAEDKQVSAYLQYTRSRVRVVRGTTFNLIIITSFSFILVASRPNIFGIISVFEPLLIIVVLGLILVSISFITFSWLQIVYRYRLRQAARHRGLIVTHQRRY